MFGATLLIRQYYYHSGKKCGHFPADAALGLEGGYTPALARLICLEGGDETSFIQASSYLWEVGGIRVSERQIQRVVGRVGEDAQAWQKRKSAPGPCEAKIVYISADATGVPMRAEELETGLECLKERVNKMQCHFAREVNGSGEPVPELVVCHAAEKLVIPAAPASAAERVLVRAPQSVIDL